MKNLKNKRPEKKKIPMVDYRGFRLKELRSPRFSHLLLLLYWPVYGLLFLYVERFYPVAHYHEVRCALDGLIPFNEFFLIPYLFWFVFLVGMLLYTLLYDTDCFRKLMNFIMFTYTAAIVVYFIFPNCQNLRPEQFQRDNLLTRFMAWFYAFDTNTNVCPSIHVIGSLAVMFAAWNTERFKSPGWKLAFAITAVLISVSTAFLKQHSCVDIVMALPVCILGYFLCFKGRKSVPSAVSGTTRQHT